MSTSNGSASDGESVKRWEGYSDYASVSNRVAASIDDAIDAYAYIESLHVENARVRPRHAAEARSRIVGAAIKLLPELHANTADTETDENGEQDVYGEILTRWTESYEDGDGLLERLKREQLQQACPDWLGVLVRDIRTAGWEIGYLQAGRTISESNLEPAEEEARQMFE